MSFKDAQLTVISLVGTTVLTVALFVPVLYLTSAADANDIKLDKMESIEASIAYRKTPQKQPQKKVRLPDPVVKPEGISHDETKKPLEKKPDDKKPAKPDDPKDPFAKFHHNNDDDSPPGKPTTAPGDFNGNEKGYAEDTKGDPYWGRLRGDMQYSPPEISKGDSAPVGCIHLTPEGKIVDTKFDSGAEDDLRTAAEAAIRQLVKARNGHPEPVPTHLLSATTKWLCFKFTVKTS